MILVAEDNETNRLVVQRQLALLGFAAEVAEDGVAALAMFARRTYGLLLTDCHMPNMDGFDLTAAVRQREQATGRRTPIVALTANALVGEAERCLQAGMDDYLAKPVRLRELGDTLARWLGDPGKKDDRERWAADHATGADSPRPSAAGVDLGVDHVPVDLALFEAMLGEVDPEMTATLHQAYAGSAVALMDVIETSIADGDTNALRQAAHAAAGAASSIAATRLTDALGRLEMAAVDADWPGIEKAMPDVRRRAAALLRYIEASAM